MNTIQPKYNNQVSFEALKGIRYSGQFNPYECIKDAEAVLAFKKSEPFKEFFKKYNGVVEFYKYDDLFSFKKNSSLYIKYNLHQEKPEKSLLKRVMQKAKDLLSSDDEKYENDINFYTSDNFLDRHYNLKNVIKDVRKSTLERLVRVNQDAALKKNREAERLKKLNEEIDRLG